MSCQPNESFLKLLSTVAIAGIVIQRIELLEREHEDAEHEPLDPVDDDEMGGEG